jgi:hypothetical protein
MPALLGRCAREPEESAAHLHRDRHRAVAGIVSFFEHDVPLAFADAKDPALKAEFARPMRR